MGRITRWVAAMASGSCAVSHMSVGPMKPAAGGPGACAASASGSARALRASTWALLRVSAQMMAGRTGRAARSRHTVPCICPENPMPRTPAGSIPASESAARTVYTAASHQSSGFCSA
ncbi:MAG: hypothetical protein M5R40_03110 [Anaerolineae bacterium]|nr:hypothetical protein [Anaerolineae bacterium]